MVFVPADLGGVDESLARRVIATARTIAPCLDSLEDGPGDDDPKPKSDAIAILVGVANDGASRGSRHIKSQRLNAAAVEYREVGSWFSDDDRSALAALCGIASRAHTPVGVFPRSTAISGAWPEVNVSTE